MMMSKRKAKTADLDATGRRSTRTRSQKINKSELMKQENDILVSNTEQQGCLENNVSSNNIKSPANSAQFCPNALPQDSIETTNLPPNGVKDQNDSTEQNKVDVLSNITTVDPAVISVVNSMPSHPEAGKTLTVTLSEAMPVCSTILGNPVSQHTDRPTSSSNTIALTIPTTMACCGHLDQEAKGSRMSLTLEREEVVNQEGFTNEECSGIDKDTPVMGGDLETLLKPKHETSGLGKDEDDSQGMDGADPRGDEESALVKKTFRKRRMGMGRFGEREKKSACKGADAKPSVCSNDGGKDKIEKTRGKEEEAEEIMEEEIIIPAESLHQENEHPNQCDGQDTKEQETVASFSTNTVGAVGHSHKVLSSDEPQTHSLPMASITGEQRDSNPTSEVSEMALEKPQLQAMEMSHYEGPEASIAAVRLHRGQDQHPLVREPIPENQRQKSALPVGEHIPGSPHKEAEAQDTDTVKWAPSIRAPACSSPRSCGLNTCSRESAAPLHGQKDTCCEEILEGANGQDLGKPPHCEQVVEPNSSAFSCVNAVSDSQLNNIMMEMEDPYFPESSRCQEDATELVCGLISELSALNRTVMATHREMESLRRAHRSTRTPQRRPQGHRRLETQPPSVPLGGQ